MFLKSVTDNKIFRGLLYTMEDYYLYQQPHHLLQVYSNFGWTYIKRWGHLMHRQAQFQILNSGRRLSYWYTSCHVTPQQNSCFTASYCWNFTIISTLFSESILCLLPLIYFIVDLFFVIFVVNLFLLLSDYYHYFHYHLLTWILFIKMDTFNASSISINKKWE